MGENSKIEWTDHTFNPWIGCQKVSPGCDNCYAEAMMDHRYGKVEWGPHGERKRTSDGNWKKPLKWNKEAGAFKREQSMLRNPRVKLMAFPMAEALSRIYPDLVRLVLPQGVVDLDKIIPPNDVQLIGSTTRVLIREDLHPQIIALLLKTMTEEHSGPGIFQRAGEFPNANDSEYPVASTAADYYRNGPSFLQRHLPIWLAVHAQRAIAAFVTILAIGIPVFNYLPKLYMWFVRENMSKLYRRIRTIEKGLQTELTIPQLVDFQNDLENIDYAASHLHVPMRHSALFMGIKVHINLVRTRLASRLVELRSKIAKVA